MRQGGGHSRGTTAAPQTPRVACWEHPETLGAVELMRLRETAVAESATCCNRARTHRFRCRLKRTLDKSRASRYIQCRLTNQGC